MVTERNYIHSVADRHTNVTLMLNLIRRKTENPVHVCKTSRPPLCSSLLSCLMCITSLECWLGPGDSIPVYTIFQTCSATADFSVSALCTAFLCCFILVNNAAQFLQYRCGHNFCRVWNIQLQICHLQQSGLSDRIRVV